MSMALLAAAAGAAESEPASPLRPWQEASVLAALQDPSPAVRVQALEWLYGKQTSNLALAKAVADALRPDLPSSAKRGAARFLGNMGPAGAALAPRVVPLLGDSVDEDVQKAARDALVAMGTGAAAAVAPEVAALLKASNPKVRFSAAETLGHLGPPGAAFASQVAVLLDDRAVDPTGVAEALSNMGPAGAAYAPRIAKLLSLPGDPSGGIRSGVARVLSHMGPAAVAVLPQIAAALKSPDPSVRANTAASLGDMLDLGPPVTALAPQVAALLQDREGLPRYAAAFTLGRMGPAGAPYAREVATLLEESGSGAAEALGGMGPAAAAAAIPPLVKWLEDPDHTDPVLRDAVGAALGKMGPAAAALVPRLIAQLKSKNLELRVHAVAALGHLGSAAKPAGVQIVALLKDPEFSVHQAAQTALVQLAAAGVPVATQVVPLLNDPDSQVGTLAQLTLGEMTLGAAAVVPQLDAMLQEPRSQSSALQVLEKMGPAAVPAAARMVAALKNHPTDDFAVDALEKMGSAAAPAVPQLAGLLKDTNPDVRIDAAEILGSIGPAAAAVLPQLAELLKDPALSGRTQPATSVRKNPALSVREAAARSIGAMGAAAAPWSPQIVRLLGGGDAKLDAAALEALDKLTQEAPLPDPTVVLSCLAASHDSGLDVPKLLLRAYLYRKPDAQDLILIRRLGNRSPDERAVLAGRGGLTSDAAFAALQSFSDAWGPAQSFSNLPKELAEASAELAPAVAGEREHAPLLLSLQQRLEPKFHTQAFAVAATLDNQRWYERIYDSSWLIGSHIGSWILLLLAYPRWRWVQSFFFWNKWPRRFFGCFYVGVLITVVPFLRRRMFMPFKESLLPRRMLEQLNERAYFAHGAVLMEKNRRTDAQRLKLTEVLGEIRGQVVLKGGSGLGKTQLLLLLAQASREPVVFLRATECSAGVITAIQKKVQGQARDQGYLRTLIYGGGLKVLIDGLNEASPDARTRITQFVEEYFSGDFILTTQPIAWEPPATARIYVLQPLLVEQIEPFLLQQWASVQDRATLTQEQYRLAVARYLRGTAQGPREGGAAPAADPKLATLSNPMDATLAAELLARGEIPDPFRLVEQRYNVMAEQFREREGREFRRQAFAERIYEWRASGEPDIGTEGFEKEVAALVKDRLMIERTELVKKEKGEEESKRWFFRHDRIMEFFLLPAFMDSGRARQQQHDLEEQFWGIYELLAVRLPDAEESKLHRFLIERAADTNRSELVNRYTLARRLRTFADGAERDAEPSAA